MVSDALATQVPLLDELEEEEEDEEDDDEEELVDDDDDDELDEEPLPLELLPEPPPQAVTRAAVPTLPRKASARRRSIIRRPIVSRSWTRPPS